MRARARPWAALVGFAVAATADAPRADVAGVCVAVSGSEHRDVAESARRALGVPSRRVDVRTDGGRAELGAACGRLVVAVGDEALRAAAESAPRAPVVRVMSAGTPQIGAPGVAPDVAPRRVLEMLRRIAPGARRVGAVFDPDRTGELMAEAREAARALGLELVALPVRGVGEAVRAFHRFEREIRVDALWLLPDGTATVQETVYYALELAHWRRMAVIGVSRWYVASGALFALSPTPEAYGAAAGDLGRQVLRGEVPAGEIHAREDALYVNERAAARLGLKLPRDVLEAAEQVFP